MNVMCENDKKLEVRGQGFRFLDDLIEGSEGGVPDSPVSEHAGAVGEGDVVAAEEARAKLGYEAYAAYYENCGQLPPEWHMLPEDCKVAFVEFANKICGVPDVKVVKAPEFGQYLCPSCLKSYHPKEHDRPKDEDPRFLRIDLAEVGILDVTSSLFDASAFNLWPCVSGESREARCIFRGSEFILKGDMLEQLIAFKRSGEEAVKYLRGKEEAK